MKADRHPELILPIHSDHEFLTDLWESPRCQRASIMNLLSSAATAASYIQYRTLNYCQQASRRPHLAKIIKVDVWKLKLEWNGQEYSFSRISQDCNLLIHPALVKWYGKGDPSLQHKQIISVDYSSEDLAFQWILMSLAGCHVALSV